MKCMVIQTFQNNLDFSLCAILLIVIKQKRGYARVQLLKVIESIYNAHLM